VRQQWTRSQSSAVQTRCRAPQIRCERRDLKGRRKHGHDFATTVEQEHCSGMIHRIVAARQIDARDRHAEFLRKPCDLGGLASCADEVRVEGMHVGCEHCGRIASRIDAHEEHAQIGQCARSLECGELDERRRTNVRTMRKAEEDERRVAFKIRCAKGSSGVRREGKRADRPGSREPRTACQLRRELSTCRATQNPKSAAPAAASARATMKKRRFMRELSHSARRITVRALVGASARRLARAKLHFGHAPTMR